MRLALAALAAFLLLAGCGGSTPHRLGGVGPCVQQPSGGLSCRGLDNTSPPAISGSTVQGSTLTASTGTWNTVPTGFSYQWFECNSSSQNCVSTGITTSSYTLGSGDVGNTMIVRVIASKGAQTTSADSAASLVVTTTVQVGAPSPAGVTCTTTLSAGSGTGSPTTVQTALSSATAGSTVCLNSGTWSTLVLTSIAPASPGVTLAAAPGQTVVVPGFEISGTSQNLTVEGFSITQPGNGNDNGIELDGTISGGVALKYNTIENQPAGAAVFSNPDLHGGTHTISGVTVEYNQIDTVGGGFQINGGNLEQANWTISHNVIGPDLGDGCSSGQTCLQHYIEFGGVTGATVDDNAFEGPYNAAARALTPPNQVHNNVLHIDGTASNIDFSGNVMWHTESAAQTLLIQEGDFDSVTVQNNLDVEDPACLTDSSCFTDPFEIYAPHGLTFNHNTVVDAFYGVELGPTCSGCYASGQSMTAEDNIDAPTSTGGNYAIWNCTSTCTTEANASGDTSANTILGGTGNVVNWTPTWADTTWTPVSGPGWSPPPSDYYQPTALGISGAGYQGTVGP